MLLTAWMPLAWSAPFDDLVADPVDVLLNDPHTPAGFRPITLSHAAEACAQRADRGTWTTAQAQACVQRIVDAAQDPRLVDVRHTLHASHYAIVLGVRDALMPEACDAEAHAALVQQLVDASMAHPTGVARSFTSAPARWPTDQAATLYGVHLYDTAHGSEHVKGPLDRFRATVGEEGLVPTELTGSVPDATVPRGSSLAFMVRYLAPVDAALARRLWRDLQDDFVVRLGPAAGLREWPAGTDRPPDIDSGPIVQGIGASATAFGRAAARAVGDEELALALQHTAHLGHWLASQRPDLDKAADSALAVAIEAQF